MKSCLDRPPTPGPPSALVCKRPIPIFDSGPGNSLSILHDDLPPLVPIDMDSNGTGPVDICVEGRASRMHYRQIIQVAPLEDDDELPDVFKTEKKASSSKAKAAPKDTSIHKK